MSFNTKIFKKRENNEDTSISLMGNIDHLSEIDGYIVMAGWALTHSRSATRDIFVPSLGPGTYESKRLPRPDVVKQFPGAELVCGFQIVVAANALTRLTEFPEVYVLDDGSDAKVKLKIGSGVLTQWSVLKHAKKPAVESREFVGGVRDVSGPQIPSLPSMPKECIELLQSKLADSKVYLEFGSGGSTVLAASIGVHTIITVESDKDWLASVVTAVSDKKQSKTIPVLVNIGETKQWGFPVSDAGWQQYWSYPLEPWLEIERRKYKPDLILIDGRFRAACFLASVSFAKPGCIILFDDYSHRNYYHFVEKFLKPIKMVGRMAVFIVPKGPLSNLELTAALTMAITDVR